MPKLTDASGWALAPVRAENYAITVDTRSVSSPPGCSGLIFGDNWSTDHHYYLFWVDPVDGEFALVKGLGASSVVLRDWTKSSAIKDGPNFLKVQRWQDRIEFVVGDQKVADLYDGDFRGFTGVGVAAWACWQGPADMRFDHFHVTPITAREIWTSDRGESAPATESSNTARGEKARLADPSFVLK